MDRRVSFFSGPGLRLSGNLRVPDDFQPGGSPRAGIVFCLGPGTGRTPSLSDFHHTPRITGALLGAGYVVLQFYYRGVRDSEGPEYRLAPMEMVEDIRSAITFLQQQSEVDPIRIGLWGATTGGANVSYVAGVDQRVRCVVSLSGIGDCGRWQRGARRYWEWVELLKKLDEDRVRRVMTGESGLANISVLTSHGPASGEFRKKLTTMYPEYRTEERLITLASVEALLEFRPETVVKGISPRAAMWIRGSEDTLVPIDESQSMYDRAGEPKALVTIAGKSHEDMYFDDGLEQVMKHSIGWFRAHL